MQNIIVFEKRRHQTIFTLVLILQLEFRREMENPQGRKEDEAGSAFPGGCFSSLFPLSNAATRSKFNSGKSQAVAVCLCPMMY
jgi:hypothetical protein